MSRQLSNDIELKKVELTSSGSISSTEKGSKEDEKFLEKESSNEPSDM